MNHKGPRPNRIAPNVINKRTLGEARTALRKQLKSYESEPLQHPFGPPSLYFAPDFFGVPRNLETKFFELMAKEGLIVPHPFGGWMHPRFEAVPQASEGEVREKVLECLHEPPFSKRPLNVLLRDVKNSIPKGS